MDLFLAICQGLGLALAIGIGGALVALFAGAMASLEAGINPDGTDYGFFAETWFLVALFALVVLGMLARGRDARALPAPRPAFHRRRPRVRRLPRRGG